MESIDSASQIDVCTTPVYCDESGFTGNNLLDASQPLFVYAAVVVRPEAAAEFTSMLIRDYNIQGDEVKGGRLVRYNKGRQAIEHTLREFGHAAKIAVHEKKFALATYFFEYIFEPALSEKNSIYYAANFHRFIAALVYANMTAGGAPAERFMAGFAEMMRNLDSSKFDASEPGILRSIDDRSFLDQVALFAFLHKRSIEEELSVVYGDGRTPNWILDLSATSLFNILSELAAKHPILDVWCDKSKPLLANEFIFSAMVNRTDMPIRRHPLSGRTFGFNLASSPRFVDSQDYPGIQLADIMASAANYAFQNRRDEISTRWLELLSPAFSNCNIMADLSYADVERVDGFVGTVILQELIKRSILKQGLFDGMEELIVSARSAYLDWAIDRGILPSGR